MGLMRLGISNPSANTDVAIYTATGPFLASIIATNKSASATSNVRMWIVPSGATLTSQYAYLAYDQDIVPQNTLETHRFALNQNDVVYVRADTADMSFMINGLKQVDIALAAGVTSYSNTAPVDVIDGMIWVDKDGNGTALNTLAGQVIQSSASTQVTLTLRGAASQTADIFDVQNSSEVDLFSVSKDGYVKTPLRPSFRYHGFTINGNGIQGGTAPLNVGNHLTIYAVGNANYSRFTAPTSGTYVFGFSALVDQSGSRNEIVLRKNGSTSIDGYSYYGANEFGGGTSQYVTVLNSFVINLSQNDYVDWYHAVAGTLYSDLTRGDRQFWGYLLG
jgi:hypothetical protein